MIRLIAIVSATALATMLSASAYAAGPFANTLSASSAQFDLGVDVSNVPVTPSGMNSFLATLSPEGQHIMVTSCQHDVADPSAAASQYTISFCDRLLSG